MDTAVAVAAVVEVVLPSTSPSSQTSDEERHYEIEADQRVDLRDDPGVLPEDDPLGMRGM